MKDTIYLILNRNRVDRMVKTRMPNLRGGEVAVKLSISIDDKHFRSPLVSAHLDVGDEWVIEPEVEVALEMEEEEEKKEND